VKIEIKIEQGPSPILVANVIDDDGFDVGGCCVEAKNQRKFEFELGELIDNFLVKRDIPKPPSDNSAGCETGM